MENDVSYTFTNLTDEIDTAPGNVLDLKHDYTFSKEDDNGHVVISKDNFTINGNNHILNGNNQSGILYITGNNVTIKNLVFVKGNAVRGGAIYSTGNITLNNVTFIENYASDRGGAIANYGGTVNCNNTRFIDNYAESGSAIYLEDGDLNLFNSFLTSRFPNMRGQIYAKTSSFFIHPLFIWTMGIL